MDFLEQPAMAFVRLDEAVLLESVLEVPVPVRFIFILLGPSESSVDYHEIGRSFSTLMSDKVYMYIYIYKFYAHIDERESSVLPLDSIEDEGESKRHFTFSIILFCAFILPSAFF